MGIDSFDFLGKVQIVLARKAPLPKTNSIRGSII